MEDVHKPDSRSLLDLVNHVVLPPKLPQAEESKECIKGYERRMLSTLLEAAQKYGEKCTNVMMHQIWQRILKMLRCVQDLEYDEPLREAKLEESISAMQIDGQILESCKPAKSRLTTSIDVLAFRVSAQNAALIFRKNTEGATIECFELLPQCEQVLSVQGALRRRFPAHAVFVPDEHFRNSHFVSAISSCLHRLHQETVERMVPSTRKAGQSHAEVRDTTNPSLITDMLMTILAVFGSPVQTVQIQKRHRDDVLWDKAFKPWRRSPLLLMMKTVIHTSLVQDHDYHQGNLEYKNFYAFALCHLLQETIENTSEGDLVRYVQMKLARRIYKLSDNAYDFVKFAASETSQNAFRRIEHQCQHLLRQDAKHLQNIDTTGVAHDTALRLEHSQAELAKVMNNDTNDMSQSTHFNPNHQAWYIIDSVGLPQLPRDSMAWDDAVSVLAAIEEWVSNEIDLWMRRLSPEGFDAASLSLLMLFTSYKDKTMNTYQQSAEQLSAMILCLATIWYTMDRIMCENIPLLKTYSPVIPEDFFTPLLLPKLQQMKALHELEGYIVSRYRDMNQSHPSIFSDPQDKGKPYFSTRFFESCTEQQELRATIDTNAAELKKEKEREWKTKSDRYTELRSQSDILECEDAEDRFGDTYHSPSCRKCDLVTQSNAIKIDVYEWPLPQNDPQAKAAVFELLAPTTFVTWRSMTWSLLTELGQKRVAAKASPNEWMKGYAGLSRYCVQKTSRLVLASSTKSFSKAHYRKTGFPCSMGMVTCNNGLSYQFIDHSCNEWVSKVPLLRDVASLCAIQLPHGPYSDLQLAVNGTCHTENEILTSQIMCSQQIGLHEYIAFGCLRADGERTQWLNISRQLGSVNLNLNTEEVHLLMQSAMWQVGHHSSHQTKTMSESTDSSLRVAHCHLGESPFCTDLLEKIQDLLDAIGLNWQKGLTLRVLVMCLLRILSCQRSSRVMAHALSLLSRARDISMQWLLNLRAEITNTTDEARLIRLGEALVGSTLLCRYTHDVDDIHLSTIVETRQAVANWITASFVQREHLAGSGSLVGGSLKCSMICDRKLARRLMPLVLAQIGTPAGKLGLEDAIRIAWESFPGTLYSWSSYSEHNTRWIRNYTKIATGSTSQLIQCNVLDGQLLVDGRPIGRLPIDYLQSEAYLRLFEHRLFSVFASDSPGMLYMSAEKFHGYTLYFGKRQGSHIIRLKHDKALYELLPANIFSGDLPVRLVSQFLHLANLVSGQVEFWPIQNKWQAQEETWCLSLSTRELIKGDSIILDKKSRISASVIAILESLEATDRIEITLTGRKYIEVALPILELHFFVNPKGHLESKELRKIVDADQSLGSLLGLRSRLLLCDEQAPLLDRVLLVPNGTIMYSRIASHVSVSVTSNEASPRYFLYHVDPILGRLRSDGSLQGNLYKAYLHGLTSTLLEDPLTRRTGTQESLYILRKQINHISGPLESGSLDILTKLSNLTPCRVFYPSYLKVMQQVFWNKSLSCHAQHDDFAPLVQKIQDAANSFLPLYTNASASHAVTDKTCVDSSDPEMLSRARHRHLSFHASCFGDSSSRSKTDENYLEDRALQIDTSRTARVYNIASSLRLWSPSMSLSVDIVKDLTDMGVVKGFHQEFETRATITSLLDTVFPEVWGALWYTCLRAEQEIDMYDLAIAFSLIAFGSSNLQLSSLKTLLAFAFSSDLRGLLGRPNVSSYSLRDGPQPKREQLIQLLKSGTKKFQAPKPSLQTVPLKQLRERHQQLVKEQALQAADNYISQWPCANPTMPNAGNLMKLRLSHGNVVNKFTSWLHNKDFLEYMRRAADILVGFESKKPVHDYSRPTWRRATTRSRTFEVFSSLSLSSLSQIPPCHILNQAMLRLREALQGDVSTASAKLAVADNNPSTAESAVLDIVGEVIAGIQTRSGSGQSDTLRLAYRADMKSSHSALTKKSPSLPPHGIQPSNNPEKKYQDHFKDYEAILLKLNAALQPEEQDVGKSLIRKAGLWPCLAVDDILELFVSCSNLDQEWSMLISNFARIIVSVQKSHRISLALTKCNFSAAWKELENDGLSEKTINAYPQWLVVQIDANIMVRPVQEKVALEMIQPHSAGNSLLQLNMGEGKTSVIIPLIVSALANGSQLCRLIVLKPLAKQMEGILKKCLGGLPGRRTYIIPFSRETKTSVALLEQISILHKECLSTGGVLLSQPEHLLSFKLLGLERMIAGDSTLAKMLLERQAWLNSNSRDILDESDEILDVRFQLVYTLGTQRNMDGQPHRWLLTQDVLDRVSIHAIALGEMDSRSIEVRRKTKADFPMICLRSNSVEGSIKARVLEDILRSKLPSLNLTKYGQKMIGAVTAFIVEETPSQLHRETILDADAGDGSLMKKVLLLRGLFVYNVLIFALKEKRWLVNYGLHPSRCLMAVPYRAKGVPDISAEFAHPDMQIILSCLSYYYSGLSFDQMCHCLRILLKSDEPSEQYSRWIDGCSALPEQLRNYAAVNMEDKCQIMQTLWPALRCSKKLVDFYLHQVVFPREGKDFGQKLSTSGWDIPLRRTASNAVNEDGSRVARSSRISTGFSGTNDNRFNLPDNIEQQDLPDLSHTSAKVLEDVLERDNLRYQCVQDQNGQQVSAKELMKQIIAADANIRVLIDVGAQIVDVDNVEFIGLWLELTLETAVEAGIYCDGQDNIMVLDRKGRVEPLHMSSLQSRMDRCLVYLDEVHTRVRWQSTDPDVMANH